MPKVAVGSIVWVHGDREHSEREHGVREHRRIDHVNKTLRVQESNYLFRYYLLCVLLLFSISCIQWGNGNFVLFY